MNGAKEGKIRTVIVDDEELSRSILKEYLSGHDDVEIVGECANGFAAVQAVNDLGPDLLFLDVQMPKLDGFEVLELVGPDVNVIFVTAYDNYALRAFEVHAVDYLMKPFDAVRLAAALERARGRRARGERTPVAVAGSARRPDMRLERVLVRSGADVQVIPVGAIDYVAAEDDYVAFHVAGKKHLKQQTLTDVQSQLDPARFVRVHRSFILNVERLVKLERYAKDSHVAILIDGTRLAVSRTGYVKLNELL